MRIQTSLPDDLFREAESLAKRLGMSKSELFRNAVVAYINAESPDKGKRSIEITELLDEVYSRESSDIDGVLLSMQFASISKEDW